MSARKRQGIKSLLDEAEKIFVKAGKKIGTGQLNRVVHKAIEDRPPSARNGKCFRVYYVVHVGNAPFRFRFFCNKKLLISENYKKYLLNVLRKSFDLSGCPIELEFSEKEQRYADG